MEINKIHVLLHNLGVDTKVYKKYVLQMQEDIDVTFWHKIVNEVAAYIADNRPEYTFNELRYYWWGAVQYYKKTGSIEETVDSMITEYVNTECVDL